MFSSERIKSIALGVIDRSKAGQTEVIISSGEASLTRFAANEIHQNISSEEFNIDIGVRVENRIGKSTANSLRDDIIDGALNSAVAMALSSDRMDYPSLEPAHQIAPSDNYFQSSASSSPLQRARIIGRLVDSCKTEKLKASGKFNVGEGILAYANSNGSFYSHNRTMAEFSATVEGRDSSGWGYLNDADLSKIDFDALFKRTIAKAKSSANPVAIEPGEYTVILEPQCVSDMMLFMQLYAFGGMSVHYGTSFLSGKVDEKVLGDNITIVDDWQNQFVKGVPFDLQGVPRQRVELIKNGTAKNFVHDRKSARLMNVKSTGHGLMEPNSHGPVPLNVVMSNGDSSIDKMISKTKKGILISRFHYTNIIDPSKMVLTGMTRDGTFLIEDGVISRAVKNLRFTESIIKILKNVTDLSETLFVNKEPIFWGGGTLVPAIRVENFKFTSTTDF